MPTGKGSSYVNYTKFLTVYLLSYRFFKFVRLSAKVTLSIVEKSLHLYKILSRIKGCLEEFHFVCLSNNNLKLLEESQ